MFQIGQMATSIPFSVWMGQAVEGRWQCAGDGPGVVRQRWQVHRIKKEHNHFKGSWILLTLILNLI